MPGNKTIRVEPSLYIRNHREIQTNVASETLLKFSAGLPSSRRLLCLWRSRSISDITAWLQLVIFPVLWGLGYYSLTFLKVKTEVRGNETQTQKGMNVCNIIGFRVQSLVWTGVAFTSGVVIACYWHAHLYLRLQYMKY